MELAQSEKKDLLRQIDNYILSNCSKLRYGIPWGPKTVENLSVIVGQWFNKTFKKESENAYFEIIKLLREYVSEGTDQERTIPHLEVNIKRIMDKYNDNI